MHCLLLLLCLLLLQLPLAVAAAVLFGVGELGGSIALWSLQVGGGLLPLHQSTGGCLLQLLLRFLAACMCSAWVVGGLSHGCIH